MTSKNKVLSCFAVVCLVAAWLSATAVAQSAVSPSAGSQTKDSPGTSTISPAPSKKPDDPQKAEPKTAKKPADLSNEPVIYEKVRGLMRFENDGTGRRQRQARIRVQTAAGLEQAGQLVFDYNAENERIEIVSVRVTKPDGTVITAGPEQVQDLSAPVAREAPMYSDSRQKHITVPGLGVGDVVEYDVIKTTFRPLTPGQFWHRWELLTTNICLDEQVELDVPRGRALKIKAPPDMKPEIREQGDRTIYHWATSTLQYPKFEDRFKGLKLDLPALLEGLQPSAPRQISFSTFQSWEEVGRWYAALERERRAVTPEIRAQAESIVRGQTTEAGKVQALYEWVARNVRYVSLSFGAGRYQPHFAGEVLTNRYGDCKDKSTLLEAMLDSQGLHSHAALIHSAWKVDPDLPSPLQFDHAITHVEAAGQEIWLDATIGVAPYRYLLPTLRGKEALVVLTESAPALRRTPENLASANSYHLEVKGAVSSASRFEGTMALEIRGDLEVLLRLLAIRIPQDRLVGFLEQFDVIPWKAKADFGLTDIKASDPTDISRPFRLEGHMQTDHDAGPQQMLSLIVKDLALDHGSILSLLPEVEKGEARLGGPQEYSVDLVVEMPAGSTANIKPVHKLIAKDFAEYESDLRWAENPPSLHASWRLKLLVPVVSGGQTTEYAAFAKEVIDDTGINRESAASKPPSRPPVSSRKEKNKDAHVAPAKAIELYDKGLADIRAGNYGNAEQLLQEAVAIDPAFDYAWHNLGRARMFLRKSAEAEAAFRRFLELRPQDAQAYSNLGWALNIQEKYAEAVEVLEKHLATSPRDGDSQRWLGYAYLHLKKPERAAPALERAIELQANNNAAHFLLGQAYAQLHKNDEAAKELERAVSLNPGGMMLNNAAYELAQTRSHLGLAESWAARAVNEVEIQLNQSSLQRGPAGDGNLLIFAHLYWDTLGWIKFQKGDLAVAEKYLAAAWELADDTTAGAHLARVQEAQGRKSDAIETLAQVLATVPAKREKTDDERDARQRLAGLLGNESLVEQRVTESRSRARARRSVQIANSAGAEGIAEYAVIIGPDSRIIELRATTPDDSLEAAAAALKSAIMPQSLPDTNITRLPRTGVLACARADQPCKFTLTPAGAAGSGQ